MARIFSNPNVFEIGNVRIDIPPEDITWSRFENHEQLDWMRSEGTMKIPSGRAALRIDVTARFPIGELHDDISTLRNLVAMTRTSPFVPVRNQYLFDHLPLLGREGQNELASDYAGDSIPCAIQGLSVIVGGDSPEIVECRLTLMYWNPAPFMGLEALTWSSRANDKIAFEYQRYIDHIDDVLNDPARPVAVPGTPQTTRIRWYNLATYNDLKRRYGIRDFRVAGRGADELVVEGWRGWGAKALERNAYYNSRTAAEFADKIVAAERGRSTPADTTQRLIQQPDLDPVEFLIERYYNSGGFTNPKRDRRKAQKEWATARDLTDRGLRIYVSRVLEISKEEQREGTERVDRERPPAPSMAVDPTKNKITEGMQDPVDPVHEKLFRDGDADRPGGWWRVDTNNIQALDPVFRQQGAPNTVELTPRALRQTDNQLVTGLTISFQNKFSLLPVQGYPYPALQHLGARDSEVVIAVAAMSPTEQYPALRGVMQMLHDMSHRTIAMRGKLYSGREIHAVSEMRLENKILNSLGLANFIMTSVNVGRDPESPEVVRLTLTLTENNVVDEELRGHLNWSDDGYQLALFKFLTEGQWEGQDLPTGLRPILKTLQGLWEMAQRAHFENKTAIEDNAKTIREGIETLVVPDQVRTVSHPMIEHTSPIIEGSWTPPRTPDGQVLTRKFKHVPLKSSWPLSEFDPVSNITQDHLLNVQNNRYNYLPVVLDEDKIIGSDFGNTVLEMLNFWVGNLPAHSTDLVKYTDAVSALYLSTSQGRELFDSARLLADLFRKFNQQSLNPSEDVANEIRATARRYLKAWNECHFEWYRDHQIKRTLYVLAQEYPDVFSAVNDEYGRMTEAKPGCYRDLFLGDPKFLETDPYAWLDAYALGDLRQQVSAFADGTAEYAQTVKEFAQTEYENQDDEPRAAYIDRKSMYGEKDATNTTKTYEEMIQNAKEGRGQYFSQSALFRRRSAQEVIQGIREIEPTQFTVRRCFPTFKLFFVEEDDKGIIKTFNEFYSYNAVLDWSLHEAVNRPATLLVTCTNLFNHLDNIIISDTISEDQKDQLRSAARTAGYTGIIQRENNGQNREGFTGQERDIQNIMLKPGAKVVLKAGYSNNPDRLVTVFAGQVTDITPGDVMTIVCQDWASELLVPWDPDYGKSGIDEVGWWERFFTDNERDVTGTKGTQLMIHDIMGQISSRHLGGFKIGPANPYVVFSNNWVQQRVAKKAQKVGTAAGDRSMENIKPTQMPFYSAFGIIDEMIPVEYKGRYNWEIIQELRLRHCNNITFVRPYGSGDGTLYFGPPWGRYTATDTTRSRDPRLWHMDNELGFEAFSEMIRNGDTIELNDIDFVPKANKIRYEGDRTFLGRFLINRVTSINPNVGKYRGRAPIYTVLADPKITDILFRQTGDAAKYWTRLQEATGESSREVLFVSTPKHLNATASPAIMRVYYDALKARGHLPIGSTTIAAEHEAATELLRRTQQVLGEFILAKTMQDLQERVEEGELDAETENISIRLLQELREIKRPVRKWHVATSKHHIIANNMTVNSNFYNAVVVPGSEDEVFVQFDPGLTDPRTKWAQELADLKDTAVRGFMAVSMLRDELRRMYRGEIIMTGNPDIRPHDILVISDDIRQIFGAVEVDKVVHRMDTQNGFITIVTPALICEAGDMTMSHAYQAFYSQLASDLEQLQDHGALGRTIARIQSVKFKPFNLGNLDKTIDDMHDAGASPGDNIGLQSTVIGGATGAVGVGAIGGGVAGTVGVATGAVAGGIAAVALPLSLLLAGGLLIGAGIAYFSMQNMALKDYVRNHPLSITPVSKRGWPWVAGIDGAWGHTAVGQWGLNAVKGWHNVVKTLDTLKRAQVIVNETRATANSLDDIITP